MSKLSTHRAFFGSKFSISPIDLEPGMIVEFSYTKKSKKKAETKRYIVMIVDPAYKRPQDKEEFTHALNLEFAPRTAILELAKQTGCTLSNSNLLARKVFAEKLIVEGTSRQFYQNKISEIISGQGKGSYRTFKTNKLFNIQLIDYIFPRSIEYFEPEELNEDEN